MAHVPRLATVVTMYLLLSLFLGGTVVGRVSYADGAVPGLAAAECLGMEPGKAGDDHGQRLEGCKLACSVTLPAGFVDGDLCLLQGPQPGISEIADVMPWVTGVDPPPPRAIG